MSGWTRFTLALPLASFSFLFLFTVVFGVVYVWSHLTVGQIILTIVMCALFTCALFASVAVGIRPSLGTPWKGIGVVVAANVLGLVATALRSYLG